MTTRAAVLQSLEERIETVKGNPFCGRDLAGALDACMALLRDFDRRLAALETERRDLVLGDVL
jgi:hypothetical protein